jgi:hypothetical protein
MGMKFEYQAIDEDGALIRGIIEASNPEKVLQILLHKQLHPLDIRALTESTVELSRLHNLRQRLQGKKKKSMKENTPKPEFKPIEEPKEKLRIDWTYVIFIVLMVGILVAAALTG